jgi:hypothetical protein
MRAPCSTDIDLFTQIVFGKSKAVPLFEAFLSSALDGGEWSASRSGRALPLAKDPGTFWIGGWVSHRAGLDTEVRGKILCLCRGSNPSHPVYRRYTD